MANKFYVGGLVTGADDGSSYADAWRTLQKVYDNLAAGDTVYMNSTISGPELLTVLVDNDTLLGTQTAPRTFKGVNGNQSADPEDDVDGTLCIVSGNSTAVDVVKNTGARGWEWYYFIKYTGATNYGHRCAATLSTGCVWLGCDYSGNSSGGWFGNSSWDQHLMIGCIANNGFYGYYLGGDFGTYFLCKAIGNNNGWWENGVGATRRIMCLAHQSTAKGIYMGDSDISIFCTSDGNQDGIDVDGLPVGVLLFSRITNNSRYGITGTIATVAMHQGFNAFYNNTTSDNDLAYDGIRLGNNTSMTGDGYTNRAADDFSIGDSSQARRDVQVIGDYTY